VEKIAELFVDGAAARLDDDVNASVALGHRQIGFGGDGSVTVDD
jgi:hypothetical protein